MTTASSAPEIIGQALQLPLIDRSYLARKLILSLEDEDEVDSEWEQAWIQECEKRMARLVAGQTELIPAEEVFRELKQVATQ
jgi:hypothetical protein